jgi:hypothetical protein
MVDTGTHWENGAQVAHAYTKVMNFEITKAGCVRPLTHRMYEFMRSYRGNDFSRPTLFRKYSDGRVVFEFTQI